MDEDDEENLGAEDPLFDHQELGNMTPFYQLIAFLCTARTKMGKWHVVDSFGTMHVQILHDRHAWSSWHYYHHANVDRFYLDKLLSL